MSYTFLNLVSWRTRPSFAAMEMTLNPRLQCSYGCRQSCLIVCVGELKDLVVINFLGPDLVSLVSQSQAMPGRSGSEMFQKHHLKATSRQS